TLPLYGNNRAGRSADPDPSIHIKEKDGNFSDPSFGVRWLGHAGDAQVSLFATRVPQPLPAVKLTLPGASNANDLTPGLPGFISPNPSFSNPVEAELQYPKHFSVGGTVSTDQDLGAGVHVKIRGEAAYSRESVNKQGPADIGRSGESLPTPFNNSLVRGKRARGVL